MNHRLVVAASAGVGLLFTLACSGGSTIDTSFLAPTTVGGGTTSCPAGAATTSDFADGTRLVLLGVHSDDAYASADFDAALPVPGRVDGDLHSNDGCWYGGGFVGDNGTEYYFYKAAFRVE